MAGDSSDSVTEKNRTKSPPIKDGVAAPDAGAGRFGLAPTNCTRVMRVLYLFAGARRKSGLARSLKIACKGTGIAVTVDEIDILRGGPPARLVEQEAAGEAS